MSETIVTGARMRVEVMCDDRRYVLRPITFGEAAELAAAEAAAFEGGPAMLAEVLRQAIERRGGPDAQRHLDALAAHEEAEVEHAAALMARPHLQEPPEAWTAWREQLQRASAAVMRADLGRKRAEAAVAEDAEVRRARSASTAAAHARAAMLLTLALVDWPGRAEGETRIGREALDALPEADVVTLITRADALRRPGVTEGKA